MRIEIDPDVQDGEITIDAIDLWWLLDEEQQEKILQDNAHWGVVERALEYQLGRGLSSPNFYSSIHKLRKMILTDSEFVNNMIVNFIETLLEELAEAKQDERAASKAFWRLYREMKNRDPDFSLIDYDTPHNISMKESRIKYKTGKIKKEIMENFRELLKEHASE